MDDGTGEEQGGVRAALRRWGVTVLAGFVILVSVGTALSAMTERRTSGWLEAAVYAYGLLAVAGSVWAVVLIHRRDRDCRRSTHVTGVMQLLLPIGPAMGFTLPRYIRTQPEKDAAAASAFFGLSLIVVMWRDLLGRTAGTSMVRSFVSGSAELDDVVPVTPTSLITIYLLTLVVPIGVGYYQRSRASLAGAEEQLVETERAAESMTHQLSRKEEREMIAREIHDKIGHKLSLVTLYAGGLEMAVENDQLSRQLRQVQESAQEAVDDLQDLMQIMRDPNAGMFRPESHSLSDLGDVIGRVLGAGHQVNSSVLINSPDAASELVTTATYRIIQELLTNSIKHAPGLPVRVKVAGGPADGISSP